MYRQRFKTTEQCFWEKVRVSPGCWEWIGALTGAGRGCFRGRSAPRVAWELVNGLPGDLYVCHRCDNPKCVNPTHLFLGTQRDNMLDMVAKGRRNPVCNAKPGENHHAARLSNNDVLDMRWLAGFGIELEVLAGSYNQTIRHTRRILSGERWKKI